MSKSIHMKKNRIGILTVLPLGNHSTRLVAHNRGSKGYAVSFRVAFEDFRYHITDLPRDHIKLCLVESRQMVYQGSTRLCINVQVILVMVLMERCQAKASQMTFFFKLLNMG